MSNLGDRTKYIGGSDIHHILNLEPYGCAYRLWAEKRGIIPDFNLQENPLFELGKALEPYIVDCYARDKQAILKNAFDLGVPTDMPFMNCHPDRIISVGSLGVKKPGILECKSCSGAVFRKIKKTGQVPDYWMVQLQSYFWFYCVNWGEFAGLNRDSGELIYIKINRNEKLISDILDSCHAFWKRVEHGPAPERLAPEDKRCLRCNRLKQCHGIENAPLPEKEAGVEYEDARNDMAIEGAQYGYKEACEYVKEAEDLKEERGNYLKSLLENRPAVFTNVGKTIYQPVQTTRWDTKRLETEHPELKQKFCKTSTSRPLRVFWRGEK